MPLFQRSSTRGTAARAAESTAPPVSSSSRPAPDHRPSWGARLSASVRASFFQSSDDGYFLSRYQVASSTTLQMWLYFNVWYVVVFILLFQMIAAWKAHIWNASLVIQLLTPMAFWSWAVIEVLRLGLGYFGNLAERVPWLLAFWMLTLFPQPVLQLYFLFIQGFAGWFTTPIETCLCLGILVFYIAELVVSYQANKRLVAKAAADFHLQPVHTGDSSGAI
ncbi:hypothetical protein AB1Y20_003922 [Prymnesium parvum]|uniref:Transmembrane protein n=1 Tax=Prymnesium parvum TaxID=97485 RepID=A0AB34J607_PRYPA|mmetsp:Transcript_25798/g.63818  ORF Transcript_25798/g.63818 Transcript_25798/m.63818 type:complete len:221 (+) Transcript_25798:24-686(+)